MTFCRAGLIERPTAAMSYCFAGTPASRPSRDVVVYDGWSPSRFAISFMRSIENPASLPSWMKSNGNWSLWTAAASFPSEIVLTSGAADEELLGAAVGVVGALLLLSDDASGDEPVV